MISLVRAEVVNEWKRRAAKSWRATSVHMRANAASKIDPNQGLRREPVMLTAALVESSHDRATEDWCAAVFSDRSGCTGASARCAAKQPAQVMAKNAALRHAAPVT
jgi:hypothetical protein